MAVEVRIPNLGESVTEGTIVRWARQDGDAVKADDVLLELETDKASMEIPAPRPGVLRILKAQGERVAVGDLVARIEEDGAAAKAPPPVVGGVKAPPVVVGGGKAPPPVVGGAKAPPAPPARPNLGAASEQEAIEPPAR